MSICRICKQTLAFPDVQGNTHFVCDGRVPPATVKISPYGQAMQISQAVADAKWTPFQQRQVDEAIAWCARTLGLFTADDVWKRLGQHFPVTKGLAGRLNAAVKRHIIVNTGATRHADRGGEHDHAQRLTVWRSI
jgi:hypothetical protein